MKMDPVRDARSAILFLIGGADSPFRPLSTMKPRILLSHLQFAQMMNTSLKGRSMSANVVDYKGEMAYATGAFEIQVLLPLRMKPPSTSSAVVSMLPGSDP